MVCPSFGALYCRCCFELLMTGTILILDISGFTQLGEHLKTTKVQKMKWCRVQREIQIYRSSSIFSFLPKGVSEGAAALAKEVNVVS
jgi:hypothetical protein